MVGNLALRPIQERDESFLRRVYASTRTEELALLPWDENQKRAFLDMQFEAQHRHYQASYPAAAFQIIELSGQPIGRLYVDHWKDEIRIVDIALLPEWRGAGIGSALLGQILRDATQACKVVSIHVERFNPALQLYRRLGFSEISEDGVYLLMEWRPPILAGAPAQNP